MQLNEHWNQISTWLEVNAPLIRQSLTGPATEEEIANVERDIGIQMPDDLKDLYRLHNGQGDGTLFYGLLFFPIIDCFNFHQGMFAESGDNIVEWHTHNNVVREIEISKASLISKIPFATGSDSYVLCVDTLPSKYGNYGQVVFIDSALERAIKVSDSITQMVSDFAKDLEHGKYAVKSTGLEPTKEIYSQLGFRG